MKKDFTDVLEIIFVVGLVITFILCVLAIRDLFIFDSSDNTRVYFSVETKEPDFIREIKVADFEPTYNTNNLLSPSNLSSEQLEKGLLHELKAYAPYFIEAEKETGINALFLSAVAAFESDWGRSNVSNRDNNLFGWTQGEGYMKFDSKEDCINHVSSKVKELYLTEGGTYHNGYSVSDVNKKYNGRKFWEESIELIMNNIYNRIEV